MRRWNAVGAIQHKKNVHSFQRTLPLQTGDRQNQCEQHDNALVDEVDADQGTDRRYEDRLEVNAYQGGPMVRPRRDIGTRQHEILQAKQC